MDNKVEKIIKSANEFYEALKKDPNSRDRSWEHCYKSFHDARYEENPDYDYLSLLLAFYLASWGMYRASSFLIQKDYKVHTPVVEEILKEKYNCLFGIDCDKLNQSDIKTTLSDIDTIMRDYYRSVRKKVRETEAKYKVSDILITKILLGTLGCVPAYDQCFVAGLRELGISSNVNYGEESLSKLVEFYESDKKRFEKTRKKFKAYDLEYPQMKLLDMGIWQIGASKQDEKRKKQQQ